MACTGLVPVSPAAAQAALGPDAAACAPGADGSAILVKVHGFRKQQGTIRVQLNDGNPSKWLEKNTWLKRVELPVNQKVMNVCLKVPGPGTYAVAVRHDEDGDRKMTQKDGGGYSRDPKLSITHLRPTHQEAAFRVGDGVTQMPIQLNYLQGLSIKPIG